MIAAQYFNYHISEFKINLHTHTNTHMITDYVWLTIQIFLNECFFYLLIFCCLYLWAMHINISIDFDMKEKL